MKRRLFTLSLAWLLVCAAPGYAQEGGSPIKVTSPLHADGTRTDTQKDLDNRTTETKTYNTANKLVQRSVFTLDAQGLETQGTLYDAKDGVVSLVTNNYDVLGQIAEQIYKKPNGTLLQRLVYTRDPKGRVTVQAFDAQGNLIQADSSASTPSLRKGSRTGTR